MMGFEEKIWIVQDDFDNIVKVGEYYKFIIYIIYYIYKMFKQKCDFLF